MASRNGKFGVGILIDAENRVTGPAETAARSMMVLGRDVAASGRIIQASMQAAAGGIAAMRTGINALKGMFSLANEAGKFTQEMAAVQAITGSTATMFKKQEKAAIEAGLATQFSPLQAAQTMRALAQAGLTATQQMDALRPSLDLAAASLGKLSPEKAAQTLNATLKTFSLGTEDSKMAMNTLINATNRFNMSVEQLPLAIGNVSRGAKALNQDMDSTMAVLGLTKNILPNISSAATLTSSAMLRIADSSVQKKLRSLGVVFSDAQGQFLPLMTIFDNLNTVLKNKYTREVDRAAVVTKLLGKRAISPFAAVTAQLDKGVEVTRELAEGIKGVQYNPKTNQAILKGAKAIEFLQLQFKASRGEVEAIPKEFIGLRKEAEKVRKEAGKGGGAGDLFVKRLLGTFRGQMVLLQGAVDTFRIAIGKPLTNAFKPFVSMLYYTFDFAAKYVTGMSDGIKNFVGYLMVGFAAAVTLAGAIFALKTALVFLGPVLWSVMLPFIKLIAVALAVMAIAKLLHMAWKSNFLGIQNILTGFWQGLKRGFNEFFGPFLNEFLPVFVSMWNDMISEIKKALMSFGLISETTSKDSIRDWADFGRLVGQALVFVAKVIIFVIGTIINLISYIAYAAGKVGSFFGWLFGYGGNKKVLPLAQVTAEKAGQKMTITQGTAPQITPTAVLPKPVQLGPVPTMPTIAPAQPANQQAPAQPAQINVQLKGDVNMSGQRVGNLLLEQQRESTQAGLIRTTIGEQ